MKIISWLKSNWKNCLLITLIFAIIALIIPTTCSINKNKNLEHNIKALTDSVQTLKLKNGSLLYEKQSLIIEKSELQKYVDTSNKEIKDLEKKLNSSIALITKLKGEVKIDTIYTKDSVYISIDRDTIINNFSYSDKWVALNGTSIIVDSTSNTRINSIEMDAPVTLVLTNNYTVGVTSENPYISFSDINSAAIENSIVNQKRKRWGIGPYIGVGVGGGTDFKGNPQFGWNVSVGIAVTYSLFQW